MIKEMESCSYERRLERLGGQKLEQLELISRSTELISRSTVILNNKNNPQTRGQ